jgi:hypothetical protein
MRRRGASARCPRRRHLRTVQTEQPSAAAISGSDSAALARSVISSLSGKVVVCPRRRIEPPIVPPPARSADRLCWRIRAAISCGYPVRFYETLEKSARYDISRLDIMGFEPTNRSDVIFSEKWPRLRGIIWPLTKIRSHFIASMQRSKLKHKMPKV